MKVEADIQYSLDGGSTVYRGFCRNLSHSGIQFKTSNELKVGNSVDLTIDTKSEKFQPMTVTVQIIRVESCSNSDYKIAGKILQYK